MSPLHQGLSIHDFLFITFDTLRYDVAQAQWARGLTPNLAALLPDSGWQRRHSPASFTYAAHQAFFAGFLPTPAEPGRHPRLFAAQFPGSETSDENTFVFPQATIVEALAARGFHTACIGGVGFFNQQSALGSVLPSLFAEAHWSPELGVTNPDSTRAQVALAQQIIARTPAQQRLFLFLNISALHQPNYFYLPGATTDSIDSHAAALRYVDAELAPLFAALRQRSPCFAVLCSDHGTCYGDDGYYGHRLAHPAVWDVPYADCLL